MRKWSLFVVLSLLAAAFITLIPAASQESDEVCSLIIADALAQTAAYCSDAGRNQACYGNLEVDAEPQPNVTDFTFSERGDIEDLERIYTMSLSDMDEDAGTWGVVRMELQADIADELRDANVTMLMFGRVSMQNDGMKASPLLARPLQAFLLQTGVDDAPCAAAPHSGILIQTPEGVAEVNLLINEVHIRLGSTIYVQAQPDNLMSISLLEGSSHVSAQGSEVELTPGMQTTIALDAQGAAAAPPSPPQPYDVDKIVRLDLFVTPVAFADTDTVAPATAVVSARGASAVAVITGPVAAVDGNLLRIYGFPIRVDPSHPLLPLVREGDMLRVEGERVIEDGQMIINAHSIAFVDIDVLISDTGETWRDPGDCTAAPPDWANAPNWVRRCVSPTNPPQPNVGSPGGAPNNPSNDGNSGNNAGNSPPSATVTPPPPPQPPGGGGGDDDDEGGGGRNDDDRGGPPWWDDDDGRGRGRDGDN